MTSQAGGGYSRFLFFSSTYPGVPGLALIGLLLLGMTGAVQAATSAQYADGWTASHPDWTPGPPSPNPLGPPNSSCVGSSNAGAIWAQFSFPALGIPAGSSIVGIEVNVNYGSVVAPSMQLYLSGATVGSSRALGSTPSAPTCNASVIRTAGGGMDDWSAGLTAADLNTAGAVQVRLTRTTGLDSPTSIDIESVELVVHHLPAGNSAPIAACSDVQKVADASCEAVVTAAEINNGSSDPEGDALSFQLAPSGSFSLGSTPVTLTVSDPGGLSDACAATVTVIDTDAPQVTLNGATNVSLECGDAFVDPGATALDACSGAVPVTVSGSVDADTPGTYTLTYTATDGSGNAGSVTRTVVVADTQPPTISLTGDNPLVLECALDSYTESGADVEDACDANPSLTISGTVDTTTPGVYMIEYVAEDSSGNTAMASRQVEVADSLAPTITMATGSTILWPPNHAYHPLSLDALVTDASDLCDASISAEAVRIDGVSSDEAENGKGDGNTENDIVIGSGDCRRVDLRAERQGKGNGRVYLIDVSVADASGNVGMATSAPIEVPRSVNSGATDDGAAYWEMSECAAVSEAGACSDYGGADATGQCLVVR